MRTSKMSGYREGIKRNEAWSLSEIPRSQQINDNDDTAGHQIADELENVSGIVASYRLLAEIEDFEVEKRV